MRDLTQNGAAVVARLRVRGGRPDPLVARQRASSLLGAARLHPATLGPHAVLCVRHFRDPLPRTLRLSGRAPASLPAAWGEAAAAALDELARRAARPARAPVPADAECVVFADRAELLACLAGDVCAGEESARWWWRALFPGRDLARDLVALWQESVECAPAALEHLSRGRSLHAFAGRLGDADARRLTRQIARRFALEHLRAHLEERDAGEEKHDARDSGGDASARLRVETGARARSLEGDATRAPWSRWVPESEAPGLGVEQRCLLGVGLTLQRAPQFARARDFAEGARRWRVSQTKSDELRPAPPRVEIIEPHAAPRAANAREAATRHGAEEVLRHQARPDATRETLPPRAHEVSTPPPASVENDAHATRSDDAQDSFVNVAPEARDEQKRAPQTLRAETSAPSRVAPVAPDGGADAPVLSESAAEAPLLEASVETRLGGLFYLLNLGLYLDLYADFCAPAEPGLPLNVWDFVALLGAELLRAGRRSDDGAKSVGHNSANSDGDAAELDDSAKSTSDAAAYADDPVWTLLARLAGRSTDDAPGGSFVPPGDWRVPAAWLARTPARGRWLRRTSEGRLRVLHPAGFLVLDVRLNAEDPAAHAEREVSAYEGFYARASSAVEACEAEGEDTSDVKDSPDVLDVSTEESFARLGGEHGASSLLLDGRAAETPLRRWLGLLTDYVRVRLRLALGLEDARDIARVLCEHAARVSLTATHLDVTFELAELPVEVRLCGLDRDPGWIPAAGRVVSFHFV